MRWILIVMVAALVGCSNKNEAFQKELNLFREKLTTGMYKADFQDAVARVRASATDREKAMPAYQLWDSAVQRELELLAKLDKVHIKITPSNFGMNDYSDILLSEVRR